MLLAIMSLLQDSAPGPTPRPPRPASINSGGGGGYSVPEPCPPRRRPQREQLREELTQYLQRRGRPDRRTVPKFAFKPEQTEPDDAQEFDDIDMSQIAWSTIMVPPSALSQALAPPADTWSWKPVLVVIGVIGIAALTVYLVNRSKKQPKRSPPRRRKRRKQLRA